MNSAAGMRAVTIPQSGITPVRVCRTLHPGQKQWTQTAFLIACYRHIVRGANAELLYQYASGICWWRLDQRYRNASTINAVAGTGLFRLRAHAAVALRSFSVHRLQIPKGLEGRTLLRWRR